MFLESYVLRIMFQSSQNCIARVCISQDGWSERTNAKSEKKLERIKILSPSRLTFPKSGSSLRISFYISTRLHSRFTASPRFTTSPLSRFPLESDSSVDLGVAERKRRRSTRLHSAFSYDNKSKLCFSTSLVLL